MSFGIAGSYLTQRLRLRMFEHLLQQDVSYFDDKANATGALCARLSGEAAHVQGVSLFLFVIILAIVALLAKNVNVTAICGYSKKL